MSMTRRAAEQMLGNGWYTAARLASEMNITAQMASGLLFNIRNGKMYTCEVTQLPGRKVKLVAIDGIDRRSSTSDLWKSALFGGKAA